MTDIKCQLKKLLLETQQKYEEDYSRHQKAKNEIEERGWFTALNTSLGRYKILEEIYSVLGIQFEIDDNFQIVGIKSYGVLEKVL